MEQTTMFTNKISTSLFNWISNHSKETKKTKRKILEEAINMYKKEIRRRELEKDFERAAKDPDTLKIAEEGMSDYWEQIKDL